MKKPRAIKQNILGCSARFYFGNTLVPTHAVGSAIDAIVMYRFFILFILKKRLL